MIKINDTEYNNYDFIVSWGKFFANINNKKIAGLAPFITFLIDNKIYLGLEFAFSKEMFKSTKKSIKTNVNNYLSDITYEDEKGWVSIITGEYDCNITRISEKDFKIELCISSGVGNIIMDTNIELL